MKRTPLKRKTPLRAYTPLKSYKHLNKVSRKQRIRNANWKKITDDKAMDLDYICQWCELIGQRSDPEGFDYLDGHHIIKRRYNVDSPEICYITHRIPCHQEIEDNNIDVREFPNRREWLRNII